MVSKNKKSENVSTEKNISDTEKFLISLNGVDQYIDAQKMESFKSVGIEALATVTVSPTGKVTSVVTNGTETARITIKRIRTLVEKELENKDQKTQDLVNDASSIFEKINKKQYDGLFEDIQKFFSTGTPVALVLQPFTTGSDFHIATKDELNKNNDVVKFENANAKGTPIKKLFNQKSSTDSKIFEAQVDIMLKQQIAEKAKKVQEEKK